MFLGDVKSVEFFNIFVKHRNGSDGRYRIRYTSKFEQGSRKCVERGLPFVLSCVMCVWDSFREKRAEVARYIC